MDQERKNRERERKGIKESEDKSIEVDDKPTSCFLSPFHS